MCYHPLCSHVLPLWCVLDWARSHWIFFWCDQVWLGTRGFISSHYYQRCAYNWTNNVCPLHFLIIGHPLLGIAVVQIRIHSSKLFEKGEAVLILGMNHIFSMNISPFSDADGCAVLTRTPLDFSSYLTYTWLTVLWNTPWLIVWHWNRLILHQASDIFA